MTTTIGSVTLTRDMFWTDEFNDPRVNASVEETIGGGVVVQEYSRAEKGRPITLTSEGNQGHQLKSVVTALKALADVPGATYTLTMGSVSKTVRFRNEVDGGAIQFQPFVPIDGDVAATYYYKGTIHLMVV